jgi:hypothetical protein
VGMDVWMGMDVCPCTSVCVVARNPCSTKNLHIFFIHFISVLPHEEFVNCNLRLPTLIATLPALIATLPALIATLPALIATIPPLIATLPPLIVLRPRVCVCVCVCL